jgi:hypothetical protein
MVVVQGLGWLSPDVIRTPGKDGAASITGDAALRARDEPIEPVLLDDFNAMAILG